MRSGAPSNTRAGNRVGFLAPVVVGCLRAWILSARSRRDSGHPPVEITSRSYGRRAWGAASVSESWRLTSETSVLPSTWGALGRRPCTGGRRPSVAQPSPQRRSWRDRRTRYAPGLQPERPFLPRRVDTHPTMAARPQTRRLSSERSHSSSTGARRSRDSRPARSYTEGISGNIREPDRGNPRRIGTPAGGRCLGAAACSRLEHPDASPCCTRRALN